MEQHIPILVAADGGQLEQYNLVLVADDDDDNQQTEQHIPDLVANDDSEQMDQISQFLWLMIVLPVLSANPQKV